MLKYLQGILYLFFPKVCMACGNALLGNEDMICVGCLGTLPKTHFHNDAENPMVKAFWGRITINGAAAMYHFEKGGRVQQLLHNLKYNGQKELGEKLGTLYGYELKESQWAQGFDIVIPVPLHKSKLRKRGYNQSEYFARGLSKALGIGVDTQLLIKTTATESQTKKNRAERVKNVHEVFLLQNPGALQNKHILLVDDVLTTGATIESCVNELAKASGAKISIATIAYAH